MWGRCAAAGFEARGGQEQSNTEASCLVALLCPTLCDPMDCSLPGSSVHGILQSRKLEWVVISSSKGSS